MSGTFWPNAVSSRAQRGDQDDVDHADRDRSPPRLRQAALDELHQGKDQVREDDREGQDEQDRAEQIEDAERPDDDQDSPQDT